MHLQHSHYHPCGPHCPSSAACEKPLILICWAVGVQPMFEDRTGVVAWGNTAKLMLKCKDFTRRRQRMSTQFDVFKPYMVFLIPHFFWSCLLLPHWVTRFKYSLEWRRWLGLWGYAVPLVSILYINQLFQWLHNCARCEHRKRVWLIISIQFIDALCKTYHLLMWAVTGQKLVGSIITNLSPTPSDWLILRILSI